MEPENDGLVQILFLYHWVIFRFHVNLPGCIKVEHEIYTLGISRGRIVSDSFARQTGLDRKWIMLSLPTTVSLLEDTILDSYHNQIVCPLLNNFLNTFKKSCFDDENTTFAKYRCVAAAMALLYPTRLAQLFSCI